MSVNWESKVLSSVVNVIDNAQHLSISEQHIEIVGHQIVATQKQDKTKEIIQMPIKTRARPRGPAVPAAT